MMKYLLFSISLALGLASCDNQSKLLREIEYRENQLTVDTLDLSQTKKDHFLLVETYEDYLKDYSETPEAAIITYKVAHYWVKMQKYGKAIQYQDLTYNNYPSLDSRVEALLLKAFVLENKLNRKKEAKAAYQLLIKNHPDHKFAKDAKLILESLNPLP